MVPKEFSDYKTNSILTPTDRRVLEQSYFKGGTPSNITIDHLQNIHEYFKSKGYSAIQTPRPSDVSGAATEMVIIDPSKIKTKSQLTDLYNQAHAKPSELPQNPLLAEARKYKSAEEFVNKIQGSKTQYTDYTPGLRTGGTSSESMRISKLGVNPNQEVTIYRGVPKGIKGSINSGDFVTTDLQSAKDYAGNGAVLSTKTKAKNLITEYSSEFDKNNPFSPGSEFIYSTESASKPLTKSQLTDIYNQATKAASLKTAGQTGLEPLQSSKALGVEQQNIQKVQIGGGLKALQPEESVFLGKKLKVSETPEQITIKREGTKQLSEWESKEGISKRSSSLDSIETPRVVKPEDIKTGEYLDPEDAIQATEFAREFGDEKTFKPIFDRFIGKREAAKTKGALVGNKYVNISVKDGFDVIDGLEGIGTNKAVGKDVALLRNEYDTLRQLANKEGLNINFKEDYITHIWKESPADVQKVLSAKGGFKYAKQRTIPTYREGLKLGLTPKYTHPAPIIAEYVTKLEQTKAALDMFKTLKKQGIIVPAKVGASNIDFEPIVAGGFPKSTTNIGDGRTYIGNWYAPKQVADLINSVFSPRAENKLLGFTANISRGVQDVSMGGGIAYTPINFFTIANSIKELTAFRGRAPFKALAHSITDGSSKRYFAQHASTIIKMQENNIPISTSFSTETLVPRALSKSIGQKAASAS